MAPKVAVLAEVAGQASPAAILIASSADGKEIAGRPAVRLGNSGHRRRGIAEDLSATQSIFGGGVIVTSKVTPGTPVIHRAAELLAGRGCCRRRRAVDVAVALSAADKASKVTNSRAGA